MGRLDHNKATRQIQTYHRVGEEFKYRKRQRKQNSIPTKKTNTKRLGGYWANHQ